MLTRLHVCAAAAARRSSATTLRALALAVVLATSACVPVPYKPAATVVREPVGADDATQVVVGSSPEGSVGESVARSIQRLEPRVVLVDSIQYVAGDLGASPTLADVMNTHAGTLPAVVEADYVLCVGMLEYRQLHDTGMAAPFQFFPVIWVGYEKRQSRSVLQAWFVDLQDPHAAQHLLADSTYSEMIASMVYGFGTVAMPNGVLRTTLAEEVAHTLAAVHPNGPIRLVVLRELAGPSVLPAANPLAASTR